MRYRIEVFGEWAGNAAPGWKPAIAGTLNGTGLPDAAASTFDTYREADEVRREWIVPGNPERMRIVEVD